MRFIEVYVVDFELLAGVQRCNEMSERAGDEGQGFDVAERGRGSREAMERSTLVLVEAQALRNAERAHRLRSR